MLVALVVASTSVRGGDRKNPLAWQESELEKAGYQTDNESLIQGILGVAEPRDRILMIYVLGRRGAQEAEPILLEVLRNDAALPIPDEARAWQEMRPRWLGREHRNVREEAAMALVRLGNEIGLDALRGLVHECDDWSRQLELAEFLAELGELSGYKYLAAPSESEDPTQRLFSMNGLGAAAAFDGTVVDGVKVDAIDRLKKMARDRDRWIRREFLIQVVLADRWCLNPEVYREAVEESVDDPHEWIADQAANILNYGALLPAREPTARLGGDDGA